MLIKVFFLRYHKTLFGFPGSLICSLFILGYFMVVNQRESKTQVVLAVSVESWSILAYDFPDLLFLELPNVQLGLAVWVSLNTFRQIDPRSGQASWAHAFYFESVLSFKIVISEMSVLDALFKCRVLMVCISFAFCDFFLNLIIFITRLMIGFNLRLFNYSWLLCQFCCWGFVRFGHSF